MATSGRGTEFIQTPALHFAGPAAIKASPAKWANVIRAAKLRLD
jgi:hypothetical protein